MHARSAVFTGLDAATIIAAAHALRQVAPVIAAPDSVLLVQLTDSHLFADVQGRLAGVATADSLQRVVELVLAEQPQIDLLVATGDISQDESLDSYRRFRQLCEPIAAPARWCPGNHDAAGTMREATHGSQLMEPLVQAGAWRVVMLDTLVAGSVAGRLAIGQLQLLERALEEAPETHHLVCLHHHPVPIGSAWMDAIGLANPEALFEVLDRHANVRALLWGHIHQEFDSMRNGVRLLASPSTGVQFEPRSEKFRISAAPPGYRWLRLHADGRLETGVSRIDPEHFSIDCDLGGY